MNTSEETTLPTETAARPTVEKSTGKLLDHCRREARWMLALWILCFVWVIGYCGLFGYGCENADLRIVLGMPAWVVWGVLLPWCVAATASSWFALVKMANDPLEEVGDRERARLTDRGIEADE